LHHDVFSSLPLYDSIYLVPKLGLLFCTINSSTEAYSFFRVELSRNFAIISSTVIKAPMKLVTHGFPPWYCKGTYPALITISSGKSSSSPKRLLPQVPQNDRLLIFPESAGISNVLGVPCRSLNWVRVKRWLEEEVAPHHFWHALQWQRAVKVGSPGICYEYASNETLDDNLERRTCVFILNIAAQARSFRHGGE